MNEETKTNCQRCTHYDRDWCSVRATVIRSVSQNDECRFFSDVSNPTTINPNGKVRQ